MIEENKKRQENETIKDWLKRVSIKDDSWLKEAKHRQKYEWFYGFVFKVRVRYYSLKRRLKTILKLHVVGVPFVCGDCNKPLELTDDGNLYCKNQCRVRKAN